MLAAAICGATMNIVVAHLHGGEISGTVDESIRHSITKLSHIHLAASEKSAQRIIKLGENSKNVFVVGAAGLDQIKNEISGPVFLYLFTEKGKGFISILIF